MQFPGFGNVFSLDEPFAKRPFRGSLREQMPTPDYYALASGSLVPTQPLRIVPYGGREPSDFIWTDAAIIRLVRRRLLELLRESNISGWSTFPVQIYNQANSLIDGYQGFSVIGRCGRIDPRLSKSFQKTMPGGTFPYFKGCFFDPDTWDGSQIFCPEGTAHIFVVRSVYEALRAANARNVAYRPISEMDFGEYEKSLFEAALRKD